MISRGLSPLARGTHDVSAIAPGYVRFIPAGAGNTASVRRTSASDSVYPRWRGEYANNQHQIQPFPGLSPLARGILQIYPANSRSVRFIPAGAGNTGVEPEIIGKKSVYPRWRGEYGPLRNPNGLVAGLSPLARGIRPRLDAAHKIVRFIPAGAGNTVQSADDPGSAPVYPRWRGEYAGVPAFRKPVFGLSPLARGILNGYRSGRGTQRFIPAGAGNTSLTARTR